MNSGGFYEEYHEVNRLKPMARSEKDRMILRYLEENKPEIGSLLDVGCLNSALMKTLIGGLKIGKYYGVDLLESGKIPDDFGKIEYQRCDIDKDDPFPGRTFDVIVASEILEHIFAPDRIFSIASTRLNPGGILLVTTPNLGAWYNRLALLLGYQPCYSEVSVRYNVGKVWTASKENVGGHLRMFTLRALKELGKCYGMETAFCASTHGGPGMLGIATGILSIFSRGLGHNLFCVFVRRQQ